MSLSFAIMNDRSIGRFAWVGTRGGWSDWSVDEYANVPITVRRFHWEHWHTGKFSTLLICRFEFFQEASIVFREHTEVFHLIFQVCDTLDTHTEGITAVYFAVYTI